MHSEKDYAHFSQKAKVRELQAEIKCEEARSPCSWCRGGCCKFGTECRKGLMVDSEYESAEDDAQEEEATVKEEMARWTVQTSAGRQVSTGCKRLEGEREARVRKQEFESKREPVMTVGEEDEEVYEEEGEELGYDGRYVVLMTSDEDEELMYETDRTGWERWITEEERLVEADRKKGEVQREGDDGRSTRRDPRVQWRAAG